MTDLHLEGAEAARFSNALAASKAANMHGTYVDNQSIEELAEKGAITLLSPDGMAGVAIGTEGEQKGNIFGVFKHPNRSNTISNLKQPFSRVSFPI